MLRDIGAHEHSVPYGVNDIFPIVVIGIAHYARMHIYRAAVNAALGYSDWQSYLDEQREVLRNPV